MRNVIEVYVENLKKYSALQIALFVAQKKDEEVAKWGIYYSEVKAPKQINGAMEVFTYGKSDKYVF